MSNWHMQKLTLTLGADLHCGDRPLGFVARTLPYVPAHIPWYALVPALVARLKLPDRYESYARVERFFDKILRFTPFFPLQGDEPQFPWQSAEARLTSHYGVALSYADRGARDNHMFETEVLPRFAPDGAPTRLQGFVFWRPFQEDELTLDAQGRCNGSSLHDLIGECQWGGQRNKGFGSIAEVVVDKAGDDHAFFAESDLTGELPAITLHNNQRAPVFLQYDPAIEPGIRGSIKPLVGRRFAKERGSGLAAEDCAIVWDVGWQSQVEQPLILTLADRRSAAARAR